MQIWINNITVSSIDESFRLITGTEGYSVQSLLTEYLTEKPIG